MSLFTLTMLLFLAPGLQELPEVTVTADDTVITRSCRLVIPPGSVIEDRNENGVIQVRGDGIRLLFAKGSVLRGAPPERLGDTLMGTAIRIEGRSRVEVKGAVIRGYRTGLHVKGGSGLLVEDCDFSDNFRQRLRSTAQAEDGADWLYPHRNDANEWMTRYGAALYLEDLVEATLRRIRVRQGQNGILLDRVQRSLIYDNDCSFLSGWGLGLWRSSDNVITRNAFDFCVRGYSHGVYNRGQDSAGILMFEQCNRNVIAENSVTHGGDGIFGFGGEESLSGQGRTGNNGNLIIDNDLSYAPAHGLEMTFSFDNRVLGNRMVGNAICGLWGGYSQNTLISGNLFQENGEMAYGLERGGVNIEHGAGNRIVANTFLRNRCGIHLWDDDDGALLARPWAKANHKGSRDNIIAGNQFSGDAIGIHLRHNGALTLAGNTMLGVEQEIEADPPSRKQVQTTEAAPPEEPRPEFSLRGDTRPVGARAALAGRAHIIMTEWGPWDHASPLVRLQTREGSRHLYEVHQLGAGDPVLEGLAPPLDARLDLPDPQGMRLLTVETAEPGIFPYALSLGLKDFRTEVRGTLANIRWKVRVFPSPCDPRKDLETWRRQGQSRQALSTETSVLDLRYGFGGPSQQGLSEEITRAALAPDHFGTLAEAKIPMRQGRWLIRTLSDDGVRVLADGHVVLENWTHHGPTRDSGEIHLASDRVVHLQVEHFELDGFAVLALEVEPVTPGL